MLFMSRHQSDSALNLNNQAFTPALPVGKLSYYDISVKKGQETSYDISLKDIPAGKDFYVMAIPLDSGGDWAKSSSYYIRK